MEFKDTKPIYLQIRDYTFEKILLKEWAAGERLPSVRELAAEMEVNPNTVMRAYDVMQADGIIFNKRGIGYFVHEDAPDKIAEGQRQMFIEEDLPQFFNSLYLLKIDIDEIKRRYLDFEKKQNLKL